MKTSPYFIDDTPMQILFFDKDANSGRKFFNLGLGTVWFDYDLHVIDALASATEFLRPVTKNQRALDLLFISNSIWHEGGEHLVEQIRSNPTLADLPIYCVASCSHKLVVGDSNCMNENWRQQNNCNQYAKIAFEPFQPCLASNHPAHLHGVLCGNNINKEITNIINNMSQYWFNAKAT